MTVRARRSGAKSVGTRSVTVSEEPLAEAEPALGIPARPAATVRKTGTARDGARRIVELLRARGLDAALEGRVARRARWPEADLAGLVGEAGDDGLERLREAVALRACRRSPRTREEAPCASST